MELDRIEVLALVHRIEAEPSPVRTLEFHMGLTVEAPMELCVFNSWVTVYLANTRVAEGNLLRILSALVHPATIGGPHHTSVYVRAPLSPEALEMVEQKRLGKDLEYRVEFHVVALPVRTNDGQSSVQLPQSIYVRGREGHSYVSGKIAQSDWVELLRRMGWSETALVELSVGPLDNRFPQARRRFEEAQDHFRRGHWNETLQSCRMVAEAVAVAIEGANGNRADPRKLRDAFDPGAKGDHLNDLTKKLGDFLQFGRHESGIVITRSDAILALHMTAALLNYWCQPKP